MGRTVAVFSSVMLLLASSASPQTRARRLADALGGDEGEASKALKRGDAGRADYIKRFYGVGQELPCHYDVVVSTDKLSFEDAAELIVQAAGGPTSG